MPNEPAVMREMRFRNRSTEGVYPAALKKRAAPDEPPVRASEIVSKLGNKTLESFIRAHQ